MYYSSHYHMTTVESNLNEFAEPAAVVVTSRFGITNGLEGGRVLLVIFILVMKGACHASNVHVGLSIVNCPMQVRKWTCTYIYTCM